MPYKMILPGIMVVFQSIVLAIAAYLNETYLMICIRGVSLLGIE